MSNTHDHRAGAMRVAARLALAVAVLALVLVTAACGGEGTAGNASPSPSESAGPLSVVDDAGEEVSLAAPAQKVVSLAPANTEIAFAIGAGDKMVAGTSYDDYPEEAKALPKIGDFSNPSVEKIIALEPDLVLASGGIQDGLRNKLTKLGVAVYVVDPTTYDGVISDIGELGQLLGVEDQAGAVVENMETAKADVVAKVGALERPTTFIEIYSQPLMTAGSGSFIDDIVTLAGGTNLGATAGEGFPNFSTEVLIEEDPAVYIAMSGSMGEPQDIVKRSGYADLSAVKNDRVYVIEDNIIARPGPRLAQGLTEMATMIHPEAFATP
ncbi:MAG: ABC transporter substrate-binding protein [Thermoleophilia bacterium]